MIVSEISDAVAAIAARVGPSVMTIGRGSGVVIAPGRVLTNAHNVRGDQVVAADVEGDLAVLEVDTADAPPVEWGSPDVTIGSPVFGVSSPAGKGLRVTFGLVSATEASFRGPRGRRIAGSIEHTAPLLPGSSGGPIVDANGLVVGINTHRLGDGFYLAIPADQALRQRIDALSRGEAPSRPRLGVAVAPAQVTRRLRRAVGLPEVDGLLVRAVEEDGPASKAGIREGDVLVEVAGAALSSSDDLLNALESAGEKVTIKIVRAADEITVPVNMEVSL
jgi:serine protease Do